MKKMIYGVIYIICLIITIYIFGNYQKNLIILRFNNEIIYGEVTNIEYVFQPRGHSYNRIDYTFDYNGKKYNKSITKSAGGLFGILTNFNSLLMNKHYRIGQKIQILYNNELKFGYIRDELSSEIIMFIILTISTPFIALIIIIGLKIKFIELIEKRKMPFQIFFKEKVFYIQDKSFKINESVFEETFDYIFFKEKVFYIQDKSFKINESVFEETFDYKKIALNRLIEGTIICYGIKKGNNFIELSYFNNDYIFRIYKNGKEYEIVNDANKDVKEHFEELVNGI